MTGLADRSCVPCKGGVPPLTEEQIVPLLAQLDGWEVEDGHHLRKSFAFPDFAKALKFVNRVGEVAEEEDHHPDIALSWGEVTVVIFTHKIDGLTESDFVFAAKTDRQHHPEPPALRQVWRADDPAHAHLLAGLLESRGIEAEVRGEELFSGGGGIVPTEAHPTVWVAVEDHQRAHDILTSHRASDDEDDEEDDDTDAEEGAE